MMRAGTLFSGIGAPECASRDIDWRWAAEIDPFACAVHKARFPGVPNMGNVMEIDWHAVEPVDLVVGGPPCQDYSVAGQRASLSGARGDLTLQYARILDAIDPAWSVTENVPGWLSTPDNAFGSFLGILVGADAALVPGRGQRWTDAGVVAGPRRTAAWRILDAQYFGVPQRRRRVFVVACRGAGNRACAEALFPLRTGLRRDTAPRRETREDIADPITRSFAKHGGASAGKDSILRNAVIALRGHSDLAIAFGGNNTAGPIEVATACNAHGGPHGRLDFESETFVACGRGGDIAATLQAAVGGNGNAGNGSEMIVAHSQRADGFDASEDGTGRGTPLIAVDWHNSAGGPNSEDTFMTLGSRREPVIAFDATQITSPGNYSVPHPGDPCHPLASRQHPPAVASAMSVRRLLPVETERLQGFPDNWTDVPYRGKPAADGPRYRAIGNSMAVPVIGWVLARVQQIAAASLEEAPSTGSGRAAA